jgi:hypothetical protein
MPGTHHTTRPPPARPDGRGVLPATTRKLGNDVTNASTQLSSVASLQLAPAAAPASDDVAPVGSYLDAFLDARSSVQADATKGSVTGGSSVASGSSRLLFESLWNAGNESVARKSQPASVGSHRSGGSVDGGGSKRISVTAADYEDVFASMPMMEERTKEMLVRAHLAANPRKMGYADARPDIRPMSITRVAPEHVAQRLEFNGNGAHGHAMATWAGSLRPALYSTHADPARAFASGDQIKNAWDGSGLAPSEVTPSYAFRHAQSTSVWAGAGDVYDRLQDVRGYTGTHRHRFDVTTGRGLGLQSRDNYAYLRSTIETEPARGAPVLPEPLDIGPHPATLSSRYTVK